jgi:hypothetical protein
MLGFADIYVEDRTSEAWMTLTGALRPVTAYSHAFPSSCMAANGAPFSEAEGGPRMTRLG